MRNRANSATFPAQSPARADPDSGAAEGWLSSKVQAASADRLAFADFLRGIAALVVVLGHFTVLYLTSPQIVSYITMGAPAPAVAMPAIVSRLVDLFDLPSTGVAVFFLISGFVIPLSLDGTSTPAYLLKRFLRISPPIGLRSASALLRHSSRPASGRGPSRTITLTMSATLFSSPICSGASTFYRSPGPYRSR